LYRSMFELQDRANLELERRLRASQASGPRIHGLLAARPPPAVDPLQQQFL
jgi:hypothetical protein